MTESADIPADDATLLRRYAADGDRAAFAVLVQRHYAFVRSAARRQAGGDAHLAEDVAQAVFIVLARRAGSIREGVPLAGWLFSVTRHAAHNAMKIRTRQHARDRRAAAEMVADGRTCAAAADQDVQAREERQRITGLLDESLARLPRVERDGVLLHFFGGQTHEQVGRSLGLTAEAARKRVGRALEKMKLFLAGRGVGAPGALAVGALCGALREEAAAAAALAPSSAVVASTTNVALIAAGSLSAAGASVASVHIAMGVSRMFAIAKLKAAAVVLGSIAGVAGLAAGGTMLVVGARSAGPAAAISSQMITITSAQPADDDRKTFATAVDEKTKVRFLGVSKFPPHEESWFTIAGEPIEPLPIPFDERAGEMNERPEHVAIFEIAKPADVVVMLRVHDGMMVSNHNNSNTEGGRGTMLIVSSFTLQGARKTVEFTLGFSTQGWQTVGTFDAPGEDEGGVDTDDYGHFRFAPVAKDAAGNAVVEVTHAETREPQRIVAIDGAGNEVVSNHVNVNGDGSTCTGTYTFELPPEKLKKLAVQVRKFDKVMEVKDVSLSPEHPTEPKIAVKDAE